MGVDEKAREGFRSVGVFNLKETAEIDTYYRLTQRFGPTPRHSLHNLLWRPPELATALAPKYRSLPSVNKSSGEENPIYLKWA